MALVREIRVGTCSWTDPSLIKSGWYPDNVKKSARERLRFYSTHFDAVEVDSSFYSIPSESVVSSWAMSSPENFLFGIKAFGLFTFHRIPLKALPEWVRFPFLKNRDHDLITIQEMPREMSSRLFEYFLSALEPLRVAEKLGYLLFQFPPSFQFSEENLHYFKKIKKRAGHLPIAIEVRNRSWVSPQHFCHFLSLLQKENLAYVAVDEPQLEWTLPPIWPLTASWGGLVRFHGRNAPAWANKGVSVQERFDYDYQPAELLPWAQAALQKACQWEKEGKGALFMMFNNCRRDLAIRAAERLKTLLNLPQRNRSPIQKTLDYPS